MAKWYYQGDINLEYGGNFMQFDEWKHGYVNCVEITDLDSACGARGMILIEERTIIVDMPEKHASALSVIGASILPNGDIDDNGRIIKKNTHAWRWCLAYALNAYGLHDMDRSVVVQPDRSEPIDHDGWHAERIRSDGLRAYVRRNFLGLKR
jgi:hypothetical protein